LPDALPATLPTSLPASAVRSASGLATVTDRLREAVSGFDAFGPGQFAGQFRTPSPSRVGVPVPAPAVNGGPRFAADPSFGQAAGVAGAVSGLPGRPLAMAGALIAGVPHGHGVPFVPGGAQYNSGLAPAGAGTAGSGGSSGPGGSLLGAQFTQLVRPGMLPLGALAQGNPFASVAPGRQPGVTPD
jgi:hypothetical protein